MGGLAATARMHLRCADALQVDYRRAPVFTTNAESLTVESQLHWKAQSKIRRITGKDSDILVFSDLFPEDEVAIWWQAYDLLRLAQDELDKTDTFLRQSNYPRFIRRRIPGIRISESFNIFAVPSQESHLDPVLR